MTRTELTIRSTKNQVKPSLLAEAKPLLRSLGKLGKAVSSGVIGALVGALIGADSTSCYDQPETTRDVDALAQQAFRPASRAIRAAGRARRGRTGGPRRRLQQAQAALNKLGVDLDRFLQNHQDPKCQAYALVAEHGLEPAKKAVARSLTYLDGIDQGERDDARHKAQTISRRKRVGKVRCEEAGKLGDQLPKGAGERNYVVYWSPPPPPNSDVKYVGISRSLKRRCQAHPDERSRNLETLNLPLLTFSEAKQVEESLIAHFGPRRESRNGAPKGTNRGQLRNRIHAVSPDRPDYCPQLLAGQSLLVVSPGYLAYADAMFTRNHRCLGVGHPR